MPKAELRFKALGTDIYLIIACEENEAVLAEKTLKKTREIYFEQEKIFSRFDGKSELSFLNNNLGKFNSVSEELQEISQLALEYNLETKGLFDPRIIENLENIGYKQDFQKKNFTADLEKIENISGNLAEDLKIENKKIFFGQRMDFSGIAKGYITDKVSRFLVKAGLENFLVDSGGDIFAKGLDEKGEKWKVGLEGISEEKILLEISDEAVATSGITRRKWKIGEKKFHHLINPQKPTEFNFDWQLVTVIAKTAVEADVWAKVLFLEGNGGELGKDKKSLFLDYKGNLFISEKIKENLSK